MMNDTNVIMEIMVVLGQNKKALEYCYYRATKTMSILLTKTYL
jgi:hypothetical protein